MKCKVYGAKITEKNTGNMESVFGSTSKILTPAEQVRFNKVKVPVTVCVDCRKDMLMAQILDV